MSTIPSPVVTGSIGALEIGTIVMTFFFGIGTVQTFHYYRGYPHDSLWLKSFIAVVWLCELGHTISVAWGTYTVTVTRFGDLSGVTLDPLPLGFAWSILFSGLLGPLVQGFFAHRVHVFSKKIYIPLVCWAASLLRLSGSLVAVVKAVKQPSLQSYGESNGWLIMLLLVVGAFVDITVAASLCYFLGRERPFAIGRTVRMLDQLMAYTIETGLVTSLTAVTILVCLKTMPNNREYYSFHLLFR
ncbi:hypothetical protein BV22DRAFT_676277 [Leucogyrophana mollusca]|uniref:Uncharacterized protein n=1 Tax=Leucogyrophana mollusca TaxID=85980 RepID=A0ACB8B9D3_9AGAM|nr:hypothetical protein BV22DRAFT_676277 [Leucogyrophana mollusca]